MVNVDYALSPNSIDGAKLLANYSSEVQLNSDETLLDTSLMSQASRRPTNRISQKSHSHIRSNQRRGIGRIHHNNTTEVASLIADSIMDAQSRFDMSRDHIQSQDSGGPNIKVTRNNLIEKPDSIS